MIRWRRIREWVRAEGWEGMDRGLKEKEREEEEREAE